MIVSTEYVLRYAITDAALKDGTAKSVAKLIFENVLIILRTPRCIFSDQKTVFKCQLMT